jgi:protein-L-isoaspartate(D-aspartate) O-methyltransferase
VNFDDRKARLVLGLRQAGVTDRRVMAAMESLPREPFVPLALRASAYEDTALPIGHQQTMSQPSVVGLMTEALQAGERMKVLEVGTGSGYQTAVLAVLCRRVYSIERHAELLKIARARFRELKLHNIVAKAGDGTLGWPEQAPFERIIVTAAAADVPPILADQLSEGGSMVVPIGIDDELQTILRVSRLGDAFETEELRDVRFVPLIPEEAGQSVR